MNRLRNQIDRFTTLSRLQTSSAVLWMIIFAMAVLQDARAWQSDNGDGTFKNPVLYADYPDPDIIRVGNDFYMVSTTFVDSPGIVVLHSKDLVNWEIVSHAASEVNGGDKYNMIGGTDYRHGFWAASIRYYKGVFYISANPMWGNGRLYYATNAAGPWQYHEFNRNTYDPGLFFDSNGTGYIVCGNSRLSLFTLNADYSQVISATNILNRRGIEGSHLVKRGIYYYLFNANPTAQPFQLTCSRSTNIFGPYETITSLDETRGGHQGAIVELVNGEWYGFVMKDSGAVGRMTFIGPIFWTNDWPMWGTPEAPGKIPAVASKPVRGQSVMQPATSDEFSSPTLGLQWQWNHNPDNSRWSLTERPGFLRLKPTEANEFWLARNTLGQKGQGPWSSGQVKFDVSHLKPGDVCGFGSFGNINGQIAVNCGADGKLFLSMNVIKDLGKDGRKTDVRVQSLPVVGSDVYLRTDLDFKTNKGECFYSFNGKTWISFGNPFDVIFDWQTGTFQGEKYAIFCFNPKPGDGYVDVDWFHFTDKPE